MTNQEKVRVFVQEHDLEEPPEYRLLDLVAEVGELAADANSSTRYGENPEEIAVNADELGDALFSLLALANSLDIDIDAALDEALRKYEQRIGESGSPSSE